MYVLNIREIRKIRRILEKQQNHPVNFHFKLEVQRPARNLWLGRISRILLNVLYKYDLTLSLPLPVLILLTDNHTFLCWPFLRIWC